MSNEIQESLGRSYNVPDDIDEDDLMGGKIYTNSTWIMMLFLCERMFGHVMLFLDEKYL